MPNSNPPPPVVPISAHHHPPIKLTTQSMVIHHNQMLRTMPLFPLVGINKTNFASLLYMDLSLRIF
ncbi:hypothetical protein ACS0TY_021111 [Phlomoides rotata]